MSWENLQCPHAGATHDDFVRRCDHPQVIGTKRVSEQQCASCYYRTLAMPAESNVPTVVLNVGCCGQPASPAADAVIDDGQLSPALSVLEVIERLRQGIRHESAAWWQWPNVQAAFRELIRGTIAELPREPMSFQGRGIVIAGGGSYFAAAYVTLRVLRHVGCTLPIQLWHFRDELTTRERALVAELGCQCVDADEHAAANGFTWHDSWWKGWQLKSYAIWHAPFREVLWLDADCYPTRNPTYLFDDLAYRERGSIFWPDLADSSCPLPPDAPLIFGAPALTDLPCESGQLLIDKGLCWRELLLALFLNRHADYTYKLLWGDKDTFPIAWRRLGREYGRLWPIATATPQAILQHDAQGEVIFQHRARDKFRLAETNFPTNQQPQPANVFNPALAHERFCFTALQELRSRVAFVDPPPYPKHLQGRGIVTAAGGEVYRASAYVLFRMLRHVGCELPIECWYVDEHERDSRFEDLCRPLQVTFVNASERGFQRTAGKKVVYGEKESAIPYSESMLDGYGLKTFAVLHSHFQEVLWLDADNTPGRDPRFLFDDAEYRRCGAIFWPDQPLRRLPLSAWRAFGAEPRDEREFETGQLLIDKRVCWAALHLTNQANEQREFCYTVVWGDKDLPHLVWRRLGQEFAMPTADVESHDGVFIQHDLEGQPLFWHRVMSNKYGVDRSNVAAGYPYHSVALAAVADYAAFCLERDHTVAQVPTSAIRRQIRIAAYNRPHYLRQVVDHLKQCENLDRFKIVGSVDQRPDGTHNPEVVAILREVTSDIRLRPRLDCNAHTHANLTDLAAEADWGFLLEDDIVLSRSALTWCLEHEAELLERADSITLIGQQLANAKEQREATLVKDYFNAWGTYFSAAGLRRALSLWQPDWNGPTPRLSWDCHLTEAGWRSLLPVVPRSKNIGHIGKHCRSDADFAEAQRDCWIDDEVPQTWGFLINGRDRKDHPNHPAIAEFCDVHHRQRARFALGAGLVTADAEAWPEQRPDLPFNNSGWFPSENAEMLAAHFAAATVLVECGSYLGLSTRFLLEQSAADVIAIDTWLGSVEHYDMAECREHRPRLYEQFIANCWPHRERLTMLRNTTANALRLLHRRGVKPHLIYLDASHETEDVALDLQLIRKFFPAAIIVGDDWSWEAVRAGVAAAGLEPTRISGNCWEFIPPKAS